MYKKPPLLLKAIAAALVLCFGAGECLPLRAMPAPRAALPSFPPDISQIDIPFEHVTLKEFHKGTSDKLVIHVQDAHSNLSGQEALAGALDHFMRRYDSPLVLVEGADRDVTLTDVRKKLSQDEWKIAAKRFLFDGVISGEEYLNLTSDHPMKIIGVEHRYLYDENLKAYAKLAEKRTDIVAYLRGIRASLDRLKSRLYPRALVAYERSKSGPLESRDFDDEWKRLDKLASSAGLVPPAEFAELAGLREVRALEEKMDFDLANADQARIFRRLTEAGVPLDRFVQPRERIKNLQASQYLIAKGIIAEARKAGLDLNDFPHYAAYARYLEAFAELRLDKLTDEIEMFEESVYAAMLNDSDARRMRAVDRFVGLLESAYNIRMTSKQFESYTRNAPAFATPAWQAFLNEKLIALGYYDDIVAYKPLLEDARPALEEFYRLVHQRDFAFVENTLRIMDVEKKNSAFLIIGGYHTAHLTQLLREKDVSYMVLTPVVTFETDRMQYEKMLLAPIDVSAEKRAKAEDGRAKRSGIRKLGVLLAPEKILEEAYGKNATLGPAARELIAARRRAASTDLNPVLESVAAVPAAPAVRSDLPADVRASLTGPDGAVTRARDALQSLVPPAGSRVVWGAARSFARAAKPDAYETLPRAELERALAGLEGEEVEIYREVETPRGVEIDENPILGRLLEYQTGISLNGTDGWISLVIEESVPRQDSDSSGESIWDRSETDLLFHADKPGRRIVGLTRLEPDPDATSVNVITTRQVAAINLHAAVHKLLDDTSAENHPTFLMKLNASMKRYTESESEISQIGLPGFYRYLSGNDGQSAFMLAAFLNGRLNVLFLLSPELALKFEQRVGDFFAQYPQPLGPKTFSLFLDWINETDPESRELRRVFDGLTAHFRAILANRTFDRIVPAERLRRNFYEAIIYDPDKPGQKSDAWSQLRLVDSDRSNPWTFALNLLQSTEPPARGYWRTLWRTARSEWRMNRDRRANGVSVPAAILRSARRLAEVTSAFWGGNASGIAEARWRTSTVGEAVPALFAIIAGHSQKDLRSAPPSRAAHRLLDALGAGEIFRIYEFHLETMIEGEFPKGFKKYLSEIPPVSLLGEALLDAPISADIDDPDASVLGARSVKQPDAETDTAESAAGTRIAVFESEDIKAAAPAFGQASEPLFDDRIEYEEFWEPKSGVWYRPNIFNLPGDGASADVLRRAVREAVANAMSYGLPGIGFVRVRTFRHAPETPGGDEWYSVEIFQPFLREPDVEKLQRTQKGFDEKGLRFLRSVEGRRELGLLHQRGGGFVSSAKLLATLPSRIEYARKGAGLETKIFARLPSSGSRVQTVSDTLSEAPFAFSPLGLDAVRTDASLLKFAASGSRAQEFFAGIAGAGTFAFFRKTQTLEVAARGGATALDGEFTPVFDAAAIENHRIGAMTGPRGGVEDVLSERALQSIAPDVQRIARHLADRIKEGREAGGIVLVLDDLASDRSLGAEDPAFRAAAAQLKPLADMLARLGFEFQVTGSAALTSYAAETGMTSYLAEVTRPGATVVASKRTLVESADLNGRKPLPIAPPAASQSEFDVLDVPGMLYQAAELSMMQAGEDPSADLVRYTARKKGMAASEWGGIRSSFRSLAAGDAGAATLEQAERFVSLPKLLTARLADLVDLMRRVARDIASAA